MKLNNYKCLNCGNDTFMTIKKPPHIGIYCSQCGRFFKWANKDDKNLIMKGEINGKA